MKPYYENELGVIYHGDCLEILPQIEKVDLVLMDPPYGINFQSNYRIIKHNKIIGDNILPHDKICMALGKAKRAAYAFCRWENIHEFPKPKSCIVWVKNNWSMGDLKHEHGRQWEACLFWCYEKHKFTKRIPDVIYANRTGNELHPTQKPVDLMVKLIKCNVCDTVLDPFLGSGTTAVAAMKLNRRFIGIEIEEKYCEIAAKRCEQARTGLTPEEQEAGQKLLFVD
jgi:site-specific DNA-methyltransferase (adenine-specific)